METSYWARWACNDLAGNLHSLMWPYVLAEGYGPWPARRMAGRPIRAG